jgi:hypothetical protein
MEKTNKIIRTTIQFAALLILLFYTVFRFIIPIVKHEPLFLDTNDGYAITGALACALVIEAVKLYIKRKAEKL